MRNVEYITNGFGELPIPQPTIGLPGANYPEDAIRQNLISSNVPVSFVNPAIATYRKFGPSGFRRTLNFVDAVDQAEHAFVRIYPNMKSQLSGPNAGVVYKRGIKSILNTAASRIGLTPLSSAILNGVNQWLDSIPNSSTDPRRFPMPLWLQSMRTWVGYLVSGVS